MKDGISTLAMNRERRTALLIAILTMLWIGCGAAAGDGPGKGGNAMREPATHRESVELPAIDQNRPSELETAIFAMG
jgi:hypothetical protein